mgnify:CR=1 FL=1
MIIDIGEEGSTYRGLSPIEAYSLAIPEAEQNPTPRQIESAFRRAVSTVLGTPTEPVDWPVFYSGGRAHDEAPA